MTNKLLLAATLALLSTAAPALAQESSAAFDSRWSPYVGCWTILQDQYGQSAPVPAGTMVCVKPSGRSGVIITTTVDGKNVLEQTIVADGSAQPVSQGDCNGTQTSSWSRDGERLFTNVELECANQPKRNASGITLLANGQWIDAQAIVIDGNSDVRLRRYRRAKGQRDTAPAGVSAPLTVEDVIEASSKVQSEALEAALDEMNTRIALNSRVLARLADNGVSPNVIDLLVAKAYPDKFEVERANYPSASSIFGASSSSYGSSIGGSTVYMGSSMYASPYTSPFYDPLYSSYYYYSPFAYPYYWGPSYSYRFGSPFYRNYYNYNNYYGFGGGGYYVGPSIPSGGSAQPGSPDSRGGDGIATSRGYTRVRPAGSSNNSGSGDTATPASRTSGSTRGVRSVGSSDSGPSSSAGSAGSSSSGASSGGYSGGGGGGAQSGGGGGGGGRTAQPR